MKKTVAVISGGEGYEHEISKASAKNLTALIDRNLYNILNIHIDKDGAWYITSNTGGKIKAHKTFPVLLGDKSGFISGRGVVPVDCAIPCLHGDFGEDGTIQGALTLAHIKYIGQDVYASALTSDKLYSKLAAEHLGIPTARFVLADGISQQEAQEFAEDKLEYPMFIKPARLGSSYGAYQIFSRSEFADAFSNARTFSKRLLIEELLPVEYELECAFMNGKISASGRVLSGGEFYDYNKKYTNGNTKTETGYINSDAERLAECYTRLLSDLIGIKDISRFDYFVTKNGLVYFNEINSIPGMTNTSLYPRLTENMGYQHGEFINLLIGKVCEDDWRI